MTGRRSPSAEDTSISAMKLTKCAKEFAWNTSVSIPMSAKVSDPRAVRCHNAFRYLSFAMLIVYFVYYVEWTVSGSGSYFERMQLTDHSRKVDMCDNSEFDFIIPAVRSSH